MNLSSHITSLSLAALLSLCFVACGDDGERTATSPATQGSLIIKAPVDFEGDSTLIASGVMTDDQAIKVLQVEGQVQSGSSKFSVVQVGIQMPPDITPGTYVLKYDITDPDQKTSAWYSRPVEGSMDEEQAFSTSGTLTITKHDQATRRIEGTFSFVTGEFEITKAPSESIEGGAFGLNYALTSEN